MLYLPHNTTTSPSPQSQSKPLLLPLSPSVECFSKWCNGKELPSITKTPTGRRMNFESHAIEPSNTFRWSKPDLSRSQMSLILRITSHMFGLLHIGIHGEAFLDLRSSTWHRGTICKSWGDYRKHVRPTVYHLKLIFHPQLILLNIGITPGYREKLEKYLNEICQAAFVIFTDNVRAHFDLRHPSSPGDAVSDRP